MSRDPEEPDLLPDEADVVQLLFELAVSAALGVVMAVLLWVAAGRGAP